MSMKNPLTLPGIEPATFRFVAQHLNHRATAVPFDTRKTQNIRKLPKLANVKWALISPWTGIFVLVTQEQNLQYNTRLSLIILIINGVSWAPKIVRTIT